jgi:chromosome segregation ATPase
MPDYNELFQQVLQQYGLIGLLVVFVVLGPLFTLMKAKNAQLQTEVKAQELLNEFARQERQRAERLEARLDAAQQQLDKAEAEVLELRAIVSRNETELQEVPRLQAQIQELTLRVSELGGRVENEQQKSQRLEAEMQTKDQQLAQQTRYIQELEQQVAERAFRGVDEVTQS